MLDETRRNRLARPSFDEDRRIQQETIEKRNRSAAKMLLNSDYPDDVKTAMNAAFAEGDYILVQSIASQHDIRGREELDAKITMFPNPDFKEVDVDEVNREIKNKFLELLTDRRTNLEKFLSEGQEIALKQSELESMSPHEIEDPNPRFLFRAAGVEGTFDSAYKAIRAYKEAHNIETVKPGDHSFRRTLVYMEEESSE